MAEEKATPRLRFGIRTLLGLMAVLALLLTFAPKYFQSEYVSIASEVDRFNAGNKGQPVTFNEVLRGVQARRFNLPTGTEERRIADRIERTKMLPRQSFLYANTETGITNAGRRTVVVINLRVVFGAKKGFVVRVRKREY